MAGAIAGTALVNFAAEKSDKLSTVTYGTTASPIPTIPNWQRVTF
jgi:hypothetical protein